MTRAANLGPDWRRRRDGTAHRKAARLLLFDPQGRLLLVRGHDADQPARSWWFTIGGGIEPGEAPRQAAVRELREEAGVTLAPDRLTGPVLTRSAEFDFFAETVRQDEVFFLAHIEGQVKLNTAAWTGVEQRFMDEVGWWHPSDLAELDVEVFPAELPDLAFRWRAGWDGHVVHLGEMNDAGGAAR